MATKTLAILLAAKNAASGPIKTVTRDVKGLGSAVKHSSGIIAKGVGIGATAAVVGFGLAVRSGLDSLAEREDVISATAAAIKATGSAAHVSGDEVRSWAEEIEKATNAAVDDKAIQNAENTLLRFTNIGHDQFKRTTEAAVDLGAAMKTGPQAGAKLLGKALADPIKAAGALRKAGIVLDEADQKHLKTLMKHNQLQKAQVFILRKVEERYKGAAAASAGPYQTALNKLADASEDAKMALATGFLPVIERVSDWLSTELAKPEVIASIKGFGESVAGLFDDAIDFAQKIPWDSIKSAMQLTGQGAKAALDLFTGMPDWVKTAVLTGWGLNKITGGAVGDLVGALGSGLIKGVLSMNAGVVNINAATVTGGGAGGIAGEVAGAAGKGGLLKTVGKAGLFVGGVAAIGYAVSQIYKGPKAMNAFTPTVGSAFAPTKVTPDAFKGIDWATIAKGMGGGKENVDATNKVKDTTQKGLNDLGGIERTGTSTLTGALGVTAARIASAVQAAKPTVNVTTNVYVTPGSIVKAGNTQVHYGKPNGSAGGGNAHGGGGNIPT